MRFEALSDAWSEVWEFLAAICGMLLGLPHAESLFPVNGDVGIILGLHRWHIRKVRARVLAQVFVKAQVALARNSEADLLTKPLACLLHEEDEDEDWVTPIAYVKLKLLSDAVTPLDREALKLRLQDLQAVANMQDSEE